MSLRITVLNRPPVPTKSTWEGVTRDRVQQWCELEIDGLRTSFQITNDPGQELAPGQYTLDAKSFNVQNGRLTIQRVVLTPLAPVAPERPATK